VALLQAGDQLHDLLLDRDVERGGRLVGDQQLRFAGDRHRDHHALLLAAGHLARIGVDLGGRIGNADLVEQFQRAAPRPRRAHVHVQPQHLADLGADGEHRIERRHRFLENHRDILAAQRAPLGRRQRQQLAAVEADAAGRHR
jgi:hypothetical protein